MTPERDLSALLVGMAAELRPGAYVFVTLDAADASAAPVEVPASVREPEGLSVVTTPEQADREGLAYDFVAAWVMLRVHSALDAVGLTAAVSTALAEVGISANVIAATPPRPRAGAPRARARGADCAAHPVRGEYAGVERTRLTCTYAAHPQWVRGIRMVRGRAGGVSARRCPR